MFVMVGYVREMTVKKCCKYAEYGSFEHLLFLLSFLISIQGRESLLGNFVKRSFYIVLGLNTYKLGFDQCE